MVDDPEIDDEDGFGRNSPVTLASVLLTNKIFEGLVEELSERMVAIRKLCKSATTFCKPNNPALPIIISILRILDEEVGTELWNLGDEDDE